VVVIALEGVVAVVPIHADIAEAYVDTAVLAASLPCVICEESCASAPCVISCTAEDKSKANAEFAD
jgi:hypothetical protein